MILGSALRQGKAIATKPSIIGSSYSASPLANALFQVESYYTTLSAQNDNNKNKTSTPHYPTSHFQSRSYHPSTSIYYLQTTDPKQTKFSSPTLPKYNLAPSVIEEIKKDLKDVDADGNGKIDSEELKELLKKHNSTFTGT
jgi:hypothetical protein|eukprot:scaffold944_cov115-Alexandrium_tamarense.AAC.9